MGTAVPCDLGHVSQQSTRYHVFSIRRCLAPRGDCVSPITFSLGCYQTLELSTAWMCSQANAHSTRPTQIFTRSQPNISARRGRNLAGNISVLQQGNLQQQTQGHKGDIAKSALPGAQAIKLTSSEATCQKSRTSRPHSPAGDKNIRACVVALAHDPHAWEAESGLLCV